VGIIRSSLEDLTANPAARELRIRTRRKPGVHIDMTPMVDVAFLLVIFFMVTALFRKPQILDLDLPPPSKSATLAHTSLLNVKVREDGRMFWHIAADSLSEVSDVDSLHGLFAERKAADADLVVIVKVDPAAPYRRMIDVLDELALARVARVTSVPLEGLERDEVNAIR